MNIKFETVAQLKDLFLLGQRQIVIELADVEAAARPLLELIGVCILRQVLFILSCATSRIKVIINEEYLLFGVEWLIDLGSLDHSKIAFHDSMWGDLLGLTDVVLLRLFFFLLLSFS